jgi:hypothetical protein
VLTRPQLVNLIIEAGRTPVERDSFYNEVVQTDELDDPVRHDTEVRPAAIPLAMMN